MLSQWRAPNPLRSLLVTSLLLVPALTLPTSAARATPSDVVISQVYGGGGNAGATFTNDFIELHNRGATTVSLAGWSVQYASAAGSSWSVTALSGSIPAGGYYLIQEAAGAGGTVPLPTPDATGSIAMSATAAKVALVSSTVALTGTCPSAVDFLGYGATANCFEGTVGPGLSNTTAALRALSGCVDTDDNASDFASGSPTPRNSASSAVSCQRTLSYLAGPNGSISGVTPQSVTHGGNGTPVTAVPDAGYHFVSWSDGVLTATRTDTNVQADLTVTASFAIDQHTLTYTAGPNGSISGTTPQTVDHGSDGTAVTAVPDPGYHFVSWSDGVLTATRTDTNVQADLSVSASFGANQVVVSQVYGGGGNAGATLTNDFIELYNGGPDPVNLTGWTVQYASAAGTSWSSTPLSGVIQPNKYYLVQEAAGAGGSLALPTPDATGGISMSATAGKVALVNDATELTGTCPSGSSIEDLVGYGAASCSETSPAPGLSNTTAALRDGNGCVDTDDNAADFASGAPNPRNSATPANDCTFTLTVDVDPPATGSVSKSPDLGSYAAGAIVQLTATPADGYRFDHWSGDATGSATPLDLTMTGDLVVTAHFLPNTLASQMVISQLYGGGGNTGADLTNDYVELYNRGNAPANITGWTIQYASAGGEVWSTTTLIGVVQPGRYYLVQESSGGGGTTSLPAADAIGTINLGASDGKLALVNNNVPLAGTCPSGGTIVDMLGYGSANCSESSPAPAMSNTLATFRGNDGCDETNNNLADFSNALPTPRNSATPANICDLWLDVGPRSTELVLSSPWPNPSHGRASVSLALPAEARVRLTVTDVMGRRIASLVDGVLPAGQHDVSWSGVGDGGPVRSGLYFMTLEVSGQRIARGFVLTR